MIGKDARIHLSRKDLGLIEKNINARRQPRDYAPTPEKRRRELRRREQRRDAGWAFVVLVVLLVLLIGGGMLAVAWLEGRL